MKYDPTKNTDRDVEFFYEDLSPSGRAKVVEQYQFWNPDIDFADPDVRINWSRPVFVAHMSVEMKVNQSW